MLEPRVPCHVRRKSLHVFPEYSEDRRYQIFFIKAVGGLMWNSNRNLLSRKVRCSRNSVMARIIHFEQALETSSPLLGESRSVLPTSSSIPGKPSDGMIDFDSCWSPISSPTAHTYSASEALAAFVSTSWTGVQPVVGDSDTHSDFDSCLSPISTPKYTVDELESLCDGERDLEFEELHFLLSQGYISHFVAHPSDEHGKRLLMAPIIPHRTVVVSGSFNPLHHGHEHLALRAIDEARDTSGQYFFEISTVNVDKGPISAAEMERRVDYILSRGHSCLLTNAILFDAKSDILPGCIFAIGYDTYVRVINPKYYTKVTGGLEATMSRVEANGCEFFVGGRVTSEGVYRSIAHGPLRRKTSDSSASSVGDGVAFDLVELPAVNDYSRSSSATSAFDTFHEEPVSPIFNGIPSFRHDISSTEIRERLQRI